MHDFYRSLQGYKTYLAAGLAIVVALCCRAGLVPHDCGQECLGGLVALALFFLRNGQKVDVSRVDEVLQEASEALDQIRQAVKAKASPPATIPFPPQEPQELKAA